MIDQADMKDLLVKNKVFFKHLSSGNNSKSLLKSATIEEIDALIYFLWNISKGKIPIKKFAFDQLDKKGLIQYLKKQFIKKDSYLIKCDRADKLKIINRVQNHFKDIFHCIFHNV